MKKLVSVLVVLALLALGLAGCGGASAGEAGGVSAGGGREVKKIAILLPGPITDESWNQGAYEGLKELESQGYEIAYTEDVQAADMESVFRSYCEEDFDFIIGHGVQYGDACVRVAQDYTDRYFFITGNPPDEENLPGNIAFYDYRECEGAFVCGAMAALMTESGIIGYVGGAENATQLSDKNAFIEGARYVNPDAELKTVITGDFNDSALGKETAIAMIEQGVDVILQTCDHTGLGVLNACDEAGLFCFGYTSNQAALVDGDIMLTSLMVSIPHMIISQIDLIEAGTFGGLQTPGLADGVVSMAPYSGQVPADVAAQVDEIVEKIKSGEIVVTPNYEL